MPFEFFNPHTCRQGCHLGSKFGEIKVDPGQYVPTPDQEKAGMTAAMFEPHVNPSFLHKTPGNVRRRLRVELQEKEKAARVAENARVAAEDAAAAVAGEEGVAVTPQAGVAVAEAPGESGGDEAPEGAASAAPPAPVAPTVPRVPVPPTGGPRRPDDLMGGSLTKSANDLQARVDRKCSSGAGKEGKKLR
jgi:hypothetical protein